MEEPEDQHGALGIGLEAKPALIGTQVIQRLVHNRQTDDGIDDVAVDADIEVHPQQHGCGMPQREQAHIDGDVLHTVEKEDHTQQEQEMIVAGDHVLGPQIGEGNKVYSSDFLDVALVAVSHGMGQRISADYQQAEYQEYP